MPLGPEARRTGGRHADSARRPPDFAGIAGAFDLWQMLVGGVGPVDYIAGVTAAALVRPIPGVNPDAVPKHARITTGRADRPACGLRAVPATQAEPSLRAGTGLEALLCKPTARLRRIGSSAVAQGAFEVLGHVFGHGLRGADRQQSAPWAAKWEDVACGAGPEDVIVSFAARRVHDRVPALVSPRETSAAGRAGPVGTAQTFSMTA